MVCSVERKISAKATIRNLYLFDSNGSLVNFRLGRQKSDWQIQISRLIDKLGR